MAGISRARFIKGQDVNPGKFARKYWIWGDTVFWHKYEIPGADSNSFECYDHEWACDRQNVYHLASKVRDADVHTFEVLNAIFRKDKNRIYCADGIAKRGDPKTFEVLDHGTARFCGGRCGYARDAEHVYFHDSGEGNVKLLRGANRDSFQVLRGGFATDGKRVYVFGRRIPKVDVATFKPLRGHYSREANQAYYLNFEMMEQVDLESFKVLGKETAKDKHRSYRMYFVDRQ